MYRPVRFSLDEEGELQCAYVGNGAVERWLRRRALCSEEAVHGEGSAGCNYAICCVDVNVRDGCCGSWACREEGVWSPAGTGSECQAPPPIRTVGVIVTCASGSGSGIPLGHGRQQHARGRRRPDCVSARYYGCCKVLMSSLRPCVVARVWAILHTKVVYSQLHD